MFFVFVPCTCYFLIGTTYFRDYKNVIIMHGMLFECFKCSPYYGFGRLQSLLVCIIGMIYMVKKTYEYIIIYSFQKKRIWGKSST